VHFLRSSFVSFSLSRSSVKTTNPVLPQGSAVLQSAYKALAGNSAVNDVTLTGTAERIAGSDDETGSVTYKAIASSSRLDLSFSSGARSEIRGSTVSGPSGTWIDDADSVSHPIAYHNLLTDVGWFPAFTIGNLLSSSNVQFIYIGQETRNDVSVIHISAMQQFPNFPPSVANVRQHLTQVDIYLDPSTLLPVSYLYNVHPDGDALLDIPSEIRYSNYQNMGGVQIPLHVQKLVNNSLVTDLQFQSPSLNTGITAAQVVAQ
jgi:hypothetical protein